MQEQICKDQNQTILTNKEQIKALQRKLGETFQQINELKTINTTLE